MSVVPSSSGIPTLTPWQMSYRGLVFAGNNALVPPYHLLELPEGIDQPDWVAGDVQRALDNGEYAGLDVSPGRDIAVKQAIVSNSAIGLDEARRAFSAILAPAGAEEQPLFIQMPSHLFACMARPRKHKFTVGINDVFAHATTCTTMFHATDPRWYSTPTVASVCSLPTTTGGLAFPFSFPATFGSKVLGNTVTVENRGGVDVRPVITFVGPVNAPKVSNLSQPGAPFVQFEQVLLAGDRLIVDFDWESAVFIPAGSPAGASRRNTEVVGSTWFTCPPGNSTLAFTSNDSTHTAATMQVEWASAFLGL